MIKNKIATKKITNLLKDKKEYSDIFVLFGELNKPIIVSSILIIENKLKMKNFSKTMVSKAKFVCIELLENMNKHQTQITSLSPYFELSVCDDEIRIVSGNSVAKDESIYLNQKLNQYSKLSKTELDDVYIKRLREGELDEEGNAGLGILSVMRRADKKFSYEFEEVNQLETYFNSEISLKV